MPIDRNETETAGRGNDGNKEAGKNVIEPTHECLAAGIRFSIQFMSQYESIVSIT